MTHHISSHCARKYHNVLTENADLYLRVANMTVTLAATTKKQLKNESQIPTVTEYKMVICKLRLLLTEIVLL